MFILSITFRGNIVPYLMGVLLIYQPGVMNRRLKPFNYCMSHNRIKSPKPAFRLPRQLPKHICYMPTHVQTTYQFGMHMQIRDTRRPLNMSSHPEVPVHPQTDSVGPSCGPLFRMVWMWPICQPKLKAHIAGKEQRAWSLDRAVSAWCFTMSSKILLSKYMCFQTCLKAQKGHYHPNYEPQFFVFIASSLGNKGFFLKNRDLAWATHEGSKGTHRKAHPGAMA